MRRNAISWLFIILAVAGNAMGAAIELRNYIFPIYDSMLNRMNGEGSALVNIIASHGTVEQVDIVAYEFAGPGGRVLEATNQRASIINALSKWEFSQLNPNETIKFQLKIVFRLSDNQTTGDKERYRYSVIQDKGLPIEIIVEADRLRPKKGEPDL